MIGSKCLAMGKLEGAQYVSVRVVFILNIKDERQSRNADMIVITACFTVLQSWVSKKFMTGCVVLFPVAVTFFITWWFIQFVDSFFIPIYQRLGLEIFDGEWSCVYDFGVWLVVVPFLHALSKEGLLKGQNKEPVIEDGYMRSLPTGISLQYSLAPNYCGEVDNAGAMMSFNENLLCSF